MASRRLLREKVLYGLIQIQRFPDAMMLIDSAEFVERCVGVRQELHIKFLCRLIQHLQQRVMRLHFDVLGFVIGVMEHLDKKFDFMGPQDNSLPLERSVSLGAILMTILWF